MIKSNYPWPEKKLLLLSRLIILRAAAKQDRYEKGSDKGGWFKSKDIPENMPMSVRYAKKSYGKWNSKRVKLAKIKKRYVDTGGNNKELEHQIKALEGNVAHLRERFDKGVARAKEKGYKINSRGDWANKPDTSVRNENISENSTRTVNGGNRARGAINTTNADDEAQKKALKLIYSSAKVNTNTGEEISDIELNRMAVLDEETGEVKQGFNLPETNKNSKRNVVNNLADKSGISASGVNEAIREWAIGSNDSAKGLSMQIAASEEFGIPLSKFQNEKIKHYEKVINANNDLPAKKISGELSRVDEAKLLRTMYDETQKKLADLGIEEVTLYRGFKDYDDVVPKSGDITIEQSAMSSWSVSPDVAKSFATGLFVPEGRVVKAVIPASRIVSCASTGFGCLSELEFVVLGSDEPDAATVFARSDFS